MAKDIDSLLDFINFTHDIRRVKRAMYSPDETVFENDSEHGYQMALTALFVIQEKKLPLDVYRAMALALVHDVLEVHAGDTPVYGAQDSLQSKDEREAEAVALLRRQWPQVPLLHELIEECEAKRTPESKFVYALDKLVPILNNFIDHGRNWVRQGATFEHMMSVKQGKINLDPTVDSYYQEILDYLRQHPDYFAPAAPSEN